MLIKTRLKRLQKIQTKQRPGPAYKGTAYWLVYLRYGVEMAESNTYLLLPESRQRRLIEGEIERLRTALDNDQITLDQLAHDFPNVAFFRFGWKGERESWLSHILSLPSERQPPITGKCGPALPCFEMWLSGQDSQALQKVAKGIASGQWTAADIANEGYPNTARLVFGFAG